MSMYGVDDLDQYDIMMSEPRERDPFAQTTHTTTGLVVTSGNALLPYSAGDLKDPALIVVEARSKPGGWCWRIMHTAWVLVQYHRREKHIKAWFDHQPELCGQGGRGAPGESTTRRLLSLARCWLYQTGYLARGENCILPTARTPYFESLVEQLQLNAKPKTYYTEEL